MTELCVKNTILVFIKEISQDAIVKYIYLKDNQIIPIFEP